ncbi:hypothetical protein R3P38DRAFT_3339963 [Favolaschia claudopus]|uniref:Uncharacterized protein n=1 Tax=Favolaschia claudopus TaxID=2862362 RepID=A0AAW0EKI0_9AGAR
MFFLYAFLTIMSWFAYFGATHLVKTGVVELISIAPTVLSSVSAMRRDLVSIFFFFHLLVLELVIGGYFLLLLTPSNKADVDSVSSMAFIPFNADRVTGHFTSGTHGAVNIFSLFGASPGYTESDPAPSMPGAYPNTVDSSTTTFCLDWMKNLGLIVFSRLSTLVIRTLGYAQTLLGLWMIPLEQPTLLLLAFQMISNVPIKDMYYAPAPSSAPARPGKRTNTTSPTGNEIPDEPSAEDESQVNICIRLCIEWTEAAVSDPPITTEAGIDEAFSEAEEADMTLVDDTHCAIVQQTVDNVVEETIRHEPKSPISATDSPSTPSLVPSIPVEPAPPADMTKPESLSNEIAVEAGISCIVSEPFEFTLNPNAAPFIPVPCPAILLKDAMSSEPASPMNTTSSDPSPTEISAKGGSSQFAFNTGAAPFVPMPRSSTTVVHQAVEPSQRTLNANAAPFVPAPPPNSPPLTPPKLTFGPTCLPRCPHRNDPPRYWFSGGTALLVTAPTHSNSSTDDPVPTTPDFWSPGRSLDSAAISINSLYQFHFPWLLEARECYDPLPSQMAANLLGRKQAMKIVSSAAGFRNDWLDFGPFASLRLNSPIRG